MRVQLNVALYSILVVFLFMSFSWLLEYIDNKPLIENGMIVTHAGVETKGRF